MRPRVSASIRGWRDAVHAGYAMCTMRASRRRFLEHLVGGAAALSAGSARRRPGTHASTAARTTGRTPGEKCLLDGMVFVWCPPGRFLMGSPATESGHRPDEAQVAGGHGSSLSGRAVQRAACATSRIGVPITSASASSRWRPDMSVTATRSAAPRPGRRAQRGRQAGSRPRTRPQPAGRGSGRTPPGRVLRRHGAARR